MDKNKLLLAKVSDKIRQYEKNAETVHTFFLDPAEQLDVDQILRKIPHYFEGGYDTAERKIAIIGDEEIDIISVICIFSNAELSHRNVLGSVLGLGIQRERIGDIIIDGNSAQVVTLKDIANYLLNNLKSVGREKVTVSEKTKSELEIPKAEEKEINVTVPSMRLDAVISSGFGMSREESSAIIKAERVNLNYKLVTSNIKQVVAGDLISVRGHGRIEIKQIVGETRKNRIRLLAVKK